MKTGEERLLNVEKQADATTRLELERAESKVKEEAVTLNIPTSRFGTFKLQAIAS